MFERLTFWFHGKAFNEVYVQSFTKTYFDGADSDEMIEFLEDAMSSGRRAYRAGKVLVETGKLDGDIFQDLEDNVNNFEKMLEGYRKDPEYDPIN